MLRNDDLNAAVKAGVITAEQKAALEKQAADRVRGRPLVSGRDERFRLLSGFNDVFLSLGIVLVAGAFLMQWSMTAFQGTFLLLLGSGVLWAISEVVVRRRRAVLPGIFAVIGIGLMVSLVAGHWAVTNLGAKASGNIFKFPYSVWMVATGAGGLATVAYYLRFGLPFAWLPMGYCLAQAVVMTAAYQFGWDRTAPLLDTISLALGLGLFALAMRFDASDPERITRRADCGFWLHLAAAPFIVQPVIAMLGARNTSSAAFATIGVVCALGFVALVVDRRALLVSSLLYFGFAVAYLVANASGDKSWAGGLTATLAILGTFVILLGLGWHPLRRLILAPFSGAKWLAYLPPLQPPRSA